MSETPALHTNNRSYQLLAVLAVACLLRLGLVAVWYTPDLNRFQNGDYTLYRIGAEHFRQNAALDNSLFLVRPPAFPLMIDLLGLNDTAVLITNAMLGALAAPLTYVLARQFRLMQRLSLFAALVVAVDPASVLYSSYLGAESLANVTLVLALILLIGSLRSSRQNLALPLSLLGGFMLAASSLARPATFLLWIVLAVWGLVAYRGRWAVIAIFVLSSGFATGVWIVHNGIVFGNYTFSTIGVYNLLYYRAASVESHGAGLSMDETYTELSRRVEERLGHDTAHVDAGTRHGHYAVTAELQPVMQSVALDVFAQYPAIYVLTIPVGAYRILGLTDVASPWLRLLFLGWNVVLVLGLGVGLVGWFRTQQRALFWLVLLVCVYYIGGTLIVQTSGIDTRARTMLTPLMAVATVYGLEYAIRNWALARRRR